MSWQWFEVKRWSEKKLHMPSHVVSVPACGATRRRRWWRVEARPTVIGAELWWAGRPRGRKSGGGGWSEKLPESRPAAATVADSKKAEEKKWGKNGKKKKERGSGMTNTAMKVVDIQQ